MIRSVFAGSLLGLALLGSQPADAQARRARYERIPPGHLPPSGMCRAWIDGVPAGRQPRATSCATARAQAARYGGVVIHGDDYYRDGERKSKGKHKAKKHDRRDRDRDDDRDDRRDRRRDRDDDDRDERGDRDDDDRYGRDGGRNRDRYCMDADRDGRCDVTQGRTRDRTRDASRPGTIPGTSWPRGSTTPTGTQRRQTVMERLEELRRMEEEQQARRRQ